MFWILLTAAEKVGFMLTVVTRFLISLSLYLAVDQDTGEARILAEQNGDN